MSNLPDAKELKKLVILCRKLGVSHFKAEGFEFTLGDEPLPVTRKSVPANPGAGLEEYKVESDGFDDLSEEDRLFWSVSSENTGS